MTQSRMRNPAMVLPDALQALLAVGKASRQGGVPPRTHSLVHLRASQINGCGFCVDMHARELKQLGVPFEHIVAVAAWQESTHFSEPERAALALTEAVTRLNDRSDPVPDAIWDVAARHYDEAALASLLLSIATVNLWNRLNVPTRQLAGASVH